MKLSVSATDPRTRRFAAVLEPQDRQRDQAGEHREAPVERVGHRALDIPGRAARLGHQRGVERLAPRSRGFASG